MTEGLNMVLMNAGMLVVVERQCSFLTLFIPFQSVVTSVVGIDGALSFPVCVSA